MATVIAYQRLFEIRILHEYYLLGPNVLSYFDLPKTERDTHFRNRVLWNQYHLRNDLLIEPDARTTTILKGLKWHFLPTLAGLSLAASAVPFQLSNGTTAKKPAISPSSGTQLLFYIRLRNPFFQNFTSIPLRRSLFSPIYYFSNNPSSVKGADFTSLSASVAVLEAGKQYEMGELARVGGVLKEAQQNTDGTNPSHWRDLSGDGYVNESDRICLPKVFFYPFAASDNIHTAIFTLKKPDGTPLPPFTVNSDGTTPLTEVAVHFEPRPPDGLYLLNINTGPVQKDLNVFLTDAYDPTALGIVHLDLDVTDPTYRILGAEDEIRNENADPAGKPIPPVFEIRLRSRKTIWRYLSYFNNRRIRPDGLADYLKQEDNTAITLAPQPYTLLPIGISSPSPGISPVSLPNADPAALKPRPPDLLYSDIRTFRTNGLIEENI
ncbi:MAG: hypothetical protein EPGJADBJ_03614 [Saprospiraceae bacterium]|nr:hypothetical protein [Saprospiraceae bacterium]